MTSTLKLEPDQVRDVDGKDHDAMRAQCSCGSGTFLVFQVVGHDHFHLQCVLCAETYCQRGEHCEGPVK